MTRYDVLVAPLRSDLRFFIQKCFHSVLPGTPYVPNWHIDAIVHQLSDRLQYPALRRKVASLAAKYEAETILIEDAGPGMALLQDLRRDLPLGMPRPIGVKPAGSKADRMVAQSAKIEAGHVHLPGNADFLDSFLHELLAFPRGRRDDQVDSVSQFLNWASRQMFFDSQYSEIGLPM